MAGYVCPRDPRSGVDPSGLVGVPHTAATLGALSVGRQIPTVPTSRRVSAAKCAYSWVGARNLLPACPQHGPGGDRSCPVADRQYADGPVVEPGVAGAAPIRGTPVGRH